MQDINAFFKLEKELQEKKDAIFMLKLVIEHEAKNCNKFRKYMNSYHNISLDIHSMFIKLEEKKEIFRFLLSAYTTLEKEFEKLEEPKKCFNCGDYYFHNHSGSKYCSIECRKEIAKTKKNIAKKSRAKLVDFEDLNHPSRIKKGKEEAKKILTCSTECLLDELGDLE